MHFFRRKFLVGAAILTFGLLLSAVLVVRAHGIESEFFFPVAELGNCENKTACRIYCDNSDNATACLDFAEKHGLLKKEEVERGRKFSTAILGEDGPGGCHGFAACRVYCELSEHADECLAFAEKHSAMTKEEIARARKFLQAVRTGQKTPGGCMEKRSCETYCADTSHADECLVFAERLGLLGKEELANARKAMTLMQQGGSPGGCDSRETCEQYCRLQGHFNECVQFAEKAGFVAKERIELLKGAGGKGPGGCDSPQACAAFCNQEGNREACFAFAKEYNLIPNEALDVAREGFQQAAGRVREGIPENVRRCLLEHIGADGVEKMQRGAFVPSSEIAQRMKRCFEVSHPQEAILLERKGTSQDKRTEIEACVKARTGSADLSTFSEQGREELFQSCFEKLRLQNSPRTENLPEAIRQGEFPVRTPMRQPGINPQTVDMRRCMELILGPEGTQKLQSGEGVSPELKERLANCAQLNTPPSEMPPPRLSPGAIAVGLFRIYMGFLFGN